MWVIDIASSCLQPCDVVALNMSSFKSVQVPSIQQTAALALGRLANYSDELAEAIVTADILPQLVYSLGEQNVSKMASHSDCSIRASVTQTLAPHAFFTFVHVSTN
jgi:hypothetical protein